MHVLIATRNRKKIIEIENKFSDIPGITMYSMADFNDAPEVEEDGKTFSENAAKKALSACRYTGLLSLADDSGLVVDALGGAPGVYSARFGGPDLSDFDRNRLLLEKMQGVPSENRQARFCCVIALAFPDGHIAYAEGVCEGVITEGMVGDYGFGYDPVFFIAELRKTMAELTLEEKNRMSHRAIALDHMRTLLLSLQGNRS